MALQSFRVENQKSIRLAEARSVPKVMVIAGPNGVGKSTLLYAIKQGGRVEDPGTRILYQGPHRVMRSTQVQRRWLGGAPRRLLELLGGGDVSGFEGLNFHNSERTPGNVDEAGSAIKHILGKIENRRQTLLASTVDRIRAAKGSLEVGKIPDIYGPLRELTEYILPHLTFKEISFASEDNILCLWNRKDASGTVPVDIDDLSSGEKAVVVLFLPLLEDQLQARLKELELFGAEGPKADAPLLEHRVILIDEPEQHLHPGLQAKILSYMRRLSEETPTQFIVTSHSPTLLDQAFDTELFVLTEATVANPPENQLKRISTNAERLEALKQLTGSTYFLTTGRVVVCIEGERDADPEKPTDARLLELLYPRATAVTLVPTTGKGNVIVTVQRLREHLAEETFKIRVRGLVDADQAGVAIEGIEQLPVCMIENLLLDPDSLFEYLQSIGVTGLGNAEAVLAELRAIALEMRAKEIALRLRRKLKPRMVRLTGSTLEELKADQAKQIADMQQSFPDDTILQGQVNEATGAVDKLIASGSELDQFRGKEILHVFYQRHIAPKNIGYNPMCIALARIVASKNRVAGRLDPVFERLMAD
ncbi:MAG: AAA family ATPase [Rhizomicrobium sp.]